MAGRLAGIRGRFIDGWTPYDQYDPPLAEMRDAIEELLGYAGALRGRKR